SATCIYITIFPSSYLLLTPAHTEFYPLSLHDALPILGPAMSFSRAYSKPVENGGDAVVRQHASEFTDQLHSRDVGFPAIMQLVRDRKSTRLNSSHVSISYAVFCLKKKKQKTNQFNHTH